MLFTPCSFLNTIFLVCTHVTSLFSFLSSLVFHLSSHYHIFVWYLISKSKIGSETLLSSHSTLFSLATSSTSFLKFLLSPKMPESTNEHLLLWISSELLIHICNCLRTSLLGCLSRSSAGEWHLPGSPQSTSEVDCLQWNMPATSCSSVPEEVSPLRKTFFFSPRAWPPTFEYFLQTIKVNSLGSFSWSFLSGLCISPV